VRARGSHHDRDLADAHAAEPVPEDELLSAEPSTGDSLDDPELG